MPRKPRFIIPDVPVHIVQRGHSRDPVFFEDADYLAYLSWLKTGTERYHCAIHAYVLMTNHIHILATPRDTDSITRMMQYVGRHYVPYINHTYGTSGSIWEGRYKASLVQDEQYLLTCMRYIELNPVRADMVRSPAHYRWSSYRANGQGKVDPLVTPHTIYLSLSKNIEQRCEAYKELFKAHLDENDLSDIRSSLQTGTPLGNHLFKQKIESRLGLNVGQAKRGRPFKGAMEDKGL
jgi:putative transposase